MYALFFNGYIYYHPPTKLREGNVFSRVCVCVCVFSEGEWDQGPDPATSKAPQSPLQGFAPLGHVQTCSTWTPLPPDIVKLIHYETRTVGERALGILLKCLVVSYMAFYLP